MILGIDEVGRGPWAGPLVVGAVVLGGADIPGLTDSKKLSKKRREALDIIIRKEAQAIGLGWVSASELDRLGMSEALRLATRRAVEQINVPYHEIIIDGTINFLSGTTKGEYVTTMPKADLLVPSVSAASIVAKVARDNYMDKQDDIYPGYNFSSHAGYGVAKHRAAIETLGVTPLHRLSFAPLAKYQSQSDLHSEVAPTARETTRAIGNRSEQVASKYLEGKGHIVLERNWRTKWCEIDIVSKIRETYYFTEVKHRTKDGQGNGMQMINRAKLRQMKFAAELYMSGKPEADMRLVAIATSGTPPKFVDYLELG
jgi:ribonuclease HII